MIFDASLSFSGKELDLFTICSPDISSASFRKRIYSYDKMSGLETMARNNSNLSPSSELQTEKRHQAALRLQKVYKSFRTRRRLADCAVLVEQRWWKIMDFAELKRSSISFFDIENKETAASRWTRATTRAAKVGKGLSKDEKARQLALQHWLEAIDPRHRYGHNLQFYYAKWLHCDSREPFFYWLDIGEGKEVNHERCSRQKLQQQCIKYLGPMERKAYEVVVVDGKFIYRQSGKLLDTSEGPEDAKWIFVLSTSKVLYVGQKKKGTFQHSSFLAGGATLSAGRLVVDAGVLKAVWPHSGHYLPTEENFEELMTFLKEQNVDLTNVKKSPTEEEEAELFRRNHIPCCPSEMDLLSQPREDANVEKAAQEQCHSSKLGGDSAENLDTRSSTWSRRLGSEITRLEIPKRIDALYMFRKSEMGIPGPGFTGRPVDSPSEDGYETADECFPEEEFMVPKPNLFGEDQEEEHDEDIIPKEKILQRIYSHKGLKSYQLAQQLSSRWTTGAGPRIGCMRDYPLELQVKVLEMTNLSPRGLHPRTSTPHILSRFSQMPPTPTPLFRDARPGASPLAPNTRIMVQTATPSQK